MLPPAVREQITLVVATVVAALEAVVATSDSASGTKLTLAVLVAVAGAAGPVDESDARREPEGERRHAAGSGRRGRARHASQTDPVAGMLIVPEGSGRWSLKQGMSGHDVIAVQIALKNAGFVIPVDGVFGESTRWALVNFQSSKGLEPDGIAGPATQEKFVRSQSLRYGKRLPHGMLPSIAANESSFLLGARTGHPSDGGYDLGAFQQSFGEHLQPTQTNLYNALSVPFMAKNTGAKVKAQHDRFVSWRRVSDRRAWELAVLFHNFELAAVRLAWGQSIFLNPAEDHEVKQWVVESVRRPVADDAPVVRRVHQEGDRPRAVVRRGDLMAEPIDKPPSTVRAVKTSAFPASTTRRRRSSTAPSARSCRCRRARPSPVTTGWTRRCSSSRSIPARVPLCGDAAGPVVTCPVSWLEPVQPCRFLNARRLRAIHKLRRNSSRPYGAARL